MFPIKKEKKLDSSACSKCWSSHLHTNKEFCVKEKTPLPIHSARCVNC